MTMRDRFLDVVADALDSDPRVAIVLAEIDVARLRLRPGAQRQPRRVINVGIREQLMISVAGGLALEGLRPVVESYAPFAVERPFEQLKLDLGHQEAGAVLVSIGGSYDAPASGRTHQSPGDVALLDTLPGWTVHVPGHPDEVEPLLRDALADTGRVYLRLSTRENTTAHPVGRFSPLRHGSRGVVLAVGPTLDTVLDATSTLDVSVLYASTIRPFDHAGLLAAVADAQPNVVLVEPYLAGTSAHEVATALADVPHRLRSLGVRRDIEVRAYGTAADHDAVHGLDAQGIGDAVRRAIS